MLSWYQIKQLSKLCETFERNFEAFYGRRMTRMILFSSRRFVRFYSADNADVDFCGGNKKRGRVKTADGMTLAESCQMLNSLR